MQKGVFSGVTLLELLIVMGIVSILSVLLFRTYNTISEIAFRIQQEKNVMDEVLSFSQMLQNFTDRNTIDYDYYSASGLVENKGLTNVLALSGIDGRFQISTIGDCVSISSLGSTGALNGLTCGIVLQRDDQEPIYLTLTGKAYIANLMFKVIPYYSPAELLSFGSVSCLQDQNYCFHKPGVWLFLDAYSPVYGATWTRQIKVPVQQFFISQ